MLTVFHWIDESMDVLLLTADKLQAAQRDHAKARKRENIDRHKDWPVLDLLFKEC